VAAPVTWDELADIDGAAAFTIKDAKLARRAASKKLTDWGVAAQTLPNVR
jgi:bifunctional non-homologous end joining protein LigD